MSQTSILQQLSRSTEADSDVDVFEQGQQYRAVGISRKGFGGEPMIDFISREGNHQCFGYSYLYRIGFDPSEGLTLEYTNHIITIEGRRLADKLRFFNAHRVIFVVEADDATIRLMDKSEEAVVTAVRIEKKERR